MMTPKELAVLAAKALDEKKGKEIAAIEITDITTLADYFVIATGSSNTQINALCGAVEKTLKEQAGELPLRREGYRDGKQTGHSGGKGGRNEGVREWTWRLSGADSGDSSVDGLRSVPGQGDSGVVRPFAARYDRFFLLGGRPFAAVSPFIGSGPLQRCWQAFLGLNNPLPRCGAGFSRTGGDVLWRGPRYRSAAVSCAQR